VFILTTNVPKEESESNDRVTGREGERERVRFSSIVAIIQTICLIVRNLFETLAHTTLAYDSNESAKSGVRETPTECYRNPNTGVLCYNKWMDIHTRGRRATRALLNIFLTDRVEASVQHTS